MDITEDEIHSAIDYLAYKAPQKFAEAKERRIICENMVKTVKSTIFLNEEGTVAEREAKALAGQEYIDASNAYATAVKEEELVRLRIAAANMKVSVWQSLGANQRAMKV